MDQTWSTETWSRETSPCSLLMDQTWSTETWSRETFPCRPLMDLIHGGLVGQTGGETFYNLRGDRIDHATW